MEKNGPFQERTLFLIGLTFLGGYLNAYTYTVRGGSFVSFQTGNLVRLGMSTAWGAWTDAVAVAAPILFCLVGICLSEFFRMHSKAADWRQSALLLEALVLLAVGFLPQSADKAVVYALGIFSGFHLCLYRTWEGMGHNTTIGTGNLRNLGTVLCKALSAQGEAWGRFVRYLLLFLSFPVGAGMGARVSEAFGRYGVWPLSVLLFIWSFWNWSAEKDRKRKQ